MILIMTDIRWVTYLFHSEAQYIRRYKHRYSYLPCLRSCHAQYSWCLHNHRCLKHTQPIHHTKAKTSSILKYIFRDTGMVCIILICQNDSVYKILISWHHVRTCFTLFPSISSFTIADIVVHHVDTVAVVITCDA
jgi:hypothetical protein